MTRLRRSEHVGHPAPVVPQRIQPPAHPAHGGPNILGHPSDLHKHPNGHQLGHLTWPKTAKPQVRRGGPLAPLKGWGHVGHPTPGGRANTTPGTPTQHHHPMTFPDVKGDPMTTDTPTNRHDETAQRAWRALPSADQREITNYASKGHAWRTGYAAAVLASSLHAGLPTPPEADHRDSGATWWTIKPANWQYPSQVVARHGGPVFINHEHFTPAEARLLAAILLAAADVAEGGTR